MKKTIITFFVAVCALMMAMPASAQLKFGVKGGLNVSELSYKVNDIKENSTGFFIGPMAEFSLPIVGLGVDGALLYNQVGKDETKQQGLDIPVNLKYTIGLGSTVGLYLAAGPDFFFNLKDCDLYNDVIKTGLKDKKAQVGLNLGAGLKLLGHLQVGFNYTLPLGNAFTAKAVGEAVKNLGDAKFNTWQISAAYLF